MDIQFDMADLRRRLEGSSMSGRQVESVTEAVGSALALHERKAELREAESRRVLEQSLVKLQCDFYRLEGRVEFARKIAQTAFIGVGGLALLLIFAL
jgi:GAF domain-containing protein